VRAARRWTTSQLPIPSLPWSQYGEGRYMQPASLVRRNHLRASFKNSLQAHDFAAPDALVGGKDDAQRSDRGPRDNSVISTRRGIALRNPLAPARRSDGRVHRSVEMSSVRLASGRPCYAAGGGWEKKWIKCVSCAVAPVMVRGTRVHLGASFATIDRCLRPDHVLHKISGLAHHRPHPTSYHRPILSNTM